MVDDAKALDALMFPKKKRELDPKYVAWIHGWKCCIPYCNNYPVHAHHVENKARLGSDRTCIPLCPEHHIGGIGVHTVGVITFEKRHQIVFKDLVKEYNRRYDHQMEGPHHDIIRRKNGKLAF